LAESVASKNDDRLASLVTTGVGKGAKWRCCMSRARVGLGRWDGYDAAIFAGPPKWLAV
jgi:hypothetical protein